MTRMGRIALGGFALFLLCLPTLVGAAGSSGPAPGSSSEAESPYVVKKGDTLWGISRDLLQDPLLWPNLWEKNRFIQNPDRIYPGDRLVLPGKDLVPPPVAEAPKPEPAKERAEAPKPASPPMTPAPPAPSTPAVEVKLAAPEPPIPPASRHAMVCSPALVTEPAAERVGIGSLVRSVEDRAMMSMEDHVVVGLDASQSLKVGDQLTAARIGQRIIHPQTGHGMGRILFVVGLLEVTDVRDRVVRARVSYSCGPITLGDRVFPFAATPFPEAKIPQPTRRSVGGAILDSLRGEQLMGLQQIAFVDVGVSQGIAVGDVFAVLRPNRPAVAATGATFPIQPDRLGDAVVIRVTERAATLVLTTSDRAIRVGDLAVLTHQIAP
jgi:hypothetical protein